MISLMARSMLDIGLLDCWLYPDGRIHDRRTGKWYHSRLSTHELIYALDLPMTNKKLYINAAKLYRIVFDSPRVTCKPGKWKRMSKIGFPDYIVTWCGKVFSDYTGRFLIDQLSFDGYHRLCLNDDTGKARTMVISRLVAEMFIPNTYNKPEVNHINGDKGCNRVDNLEWSDGWENVAHALRTGLRKQKLTDDMIHHICQLLEKGVRPIDIQEMLGVEKHDVLGIKSGCHKRISKDYNMPHNKHFKSFRAQEW